MNVLQKEMVERCEHLSDYVIQLETLANNSNPAYSEYNGLLAILKLAAVNTLASHVPETRDWAFKLRRKRFIIEVNLIMNNYINTKYCEVNYVLQRHLNLLKLIIILT